MDLISSCFASGIGATIKIVEVIYQIRATDEQTSDILNTANHVERNLKEADRLLRQKGSLLDKDENAWAVSAIRDAREALQSVAKLIEPARVEKMTRKDIGVMTKTFWAFKSNTQARDKHAMVNVCHQTLLILITRLHSINIPTVSEIPDQGTLLPPPPYDNNMEKLWTWRDQRRNRKKSTMSLRHDINGTPVYIATTDPQELEVPFLDSNSYIAPTSIMDSQRSIPAQEGGSFNTSSHPDYLDAPPKLAPSDNESLEFSNRLMPPTAPYSLGGWLDASYSSVSLSESSIDLSGTYKRPVRPIHTSLETATNFAGRSPTFEMSTAPPSTWQQMPQPIEQDISSYLFTGNPSQSCLADPTGSNLTSQSWGSPASADRPVEKPGNPSQADHPAYKSELKAEEVESGAIYPGADQGPSIGGARRTERALMDRIWASGAWSHSSPALAGARPELGDRVPSTRERSGSGTIARGGWLVYQRSQRDSKHGREGAAERD